MTLPPATLPSATLPPATGPDSDDARLYARGAYAPPEVRRQLHELASVDGLGPRRYLRDVEARRMREAEAAAARRDREPDPALQASLF